jgi:hypothetical protein
MQLMFVRPLGELGVQIALSPELPVVMAAATTGFSNWRKTRRSSSSSPV